MTDVRPVATVFGWAEAEPGSALYAEGVQLGGALVAAGYDVRCGGYFGLMEAVSKGVRDAGGRCRGVCLDMFGDKPSNRFVSEVERTTDLFDRLRALIVGTDLLVAQYGSLGTVAEVSVAWCLRYLGHPDVGELHLVGAGWLPFQRSLGSLKVAPADAARVEVHAHVTAFEAAVLAPDLSTGVDADRPERITFATALDRLDLGLATGLTADLVGTLGAHDALEFGNQVEGGLELQQIPEEIVPLLDMVAHRYARRTPLQYLEVGLGHGGTTILLQRTLAAVGIGTSLTGVDDLSYERDGWLRGQGERLAWCESELGLRLIRGSLREPSTRAAVAQQRYDLVLVDADHSFRGCLFDVLTVLGSLDSDGTLVLHDVVDPDSPGVAKVVNLLVPHFERVDRFLGDGRCGIAALHRPDPSLDPLALVAELL